MFLMVALPLLLATQEPAASEVSVEDVARAVGCRSLWSSEHGIEILGKADVLGIEGSVRIVLAPDGRFMRELSSRYGERIGFDGTAVWRVDPSGMPSVLDLEQRCFRLCEHVVLGGEWLRPDGLWRATREPSQDSDASLAFRLEHEDWEHENDALQARVFVDRKTLLPGKWVRATAIGDEEWSLGGWKSAGGFLVPMEIDRKGRVVDEKWRFTEARPMTTDLKPLVDLPRERPKDTRFDPSVISRLECRKAPSGHLLVHPLVEDADVGWFVLDSGASVMVIDKACAEALEMPAFGRVLGYGASDDVLESQLREGGSFVLGPMRIDRLFYNELDLGALSTAMGERLAGICGYDLFARAVVSVDMKKGIIDLFDPETFVLADAAWLHLTLHLNHPHVLCAFEGDEEGVFRLDVGAALPNVIFHGPAVERLKLLEGRESKILRGLQGAAGGVSARVGILEWFELGGERFENVSAMFTTENRGAIADPWTLGTIGGGLMGRFVVVFDYPHRRIAFQPTSD